MAARATTSARPLRGQAGRQALGRRAGRDDVHDPGGREVHASESHAKATRMVLDAMRPGLYALRCTSTRRLSHAHGIRRNEMRFMWLVDPEVHDLDMHARLA